MQTRHNVLDDALLSFRQASTGALCKVTLPQLFAAMARDEVRDFPALRPHQRHPWHAFLVQVAAIALHRANREEPFENAAAWREGLLALTPDQPDGAAWSLVSLLDQPALLQPPVPEASLTGWKSIPTPDALDMLVTSKNHDLKGERMRGASPEDWLLALLSLQTQEGFLGAGNYGISRMNGGFASRPGLGVLPQGCWGKRWQRDVLVLLAERESILANEEMAAQAGHVLLWLLPWDGTSSIGFASLDPLYVEICRRVRLIQHDGQMTALGIGSKKARVEAKERNGRTGDAWTPIDVSGGKALTITGDGFDYKRMSDLLFEDSTYLKPVALRVRRDDGQTGLHVIAQSITRGQGKTEGYHERRVFISPKTAGFLSRGTTDVPARLAEARIESIGALRKLLWGAVCVLLRNGDGDDASDPQKARAGRYARRFELAEDARFFDDLAQAIEAEESERAEIFDNWLKACFERAEAILRDAFPTVPRSGIQRYRAQAAALRYLHGRVRGPKSPLPALRDLLAQRPDQQETEASDVS